MPTNIPIQVQVGNLPAGFCPVGPTAWQQALNAFMQACLFTLPGTFNGVNFGPIKPGPDDTDKPWFRTFLDGTPDGMYSYINGQWVRPHPMIPGAIMLWRGALPDFTTFDGGDNNAAVGYAQGAMWQEVVEARGRSPVHPGQYDPALPSHSYAVKDKFGAETITVGAANLPPHYHRFNQSQGLFSGADLPASTNLGFSNGPVQPYYTNFNGDDSSPTVNEIPPTPPNPAPTVTPLNLFTPVYGVYLLERTSRVAYSV